MTESRSVNLEFRWTFAAIKSFEKRGREILKRMDIRNDKGILLATAPMHAGMILSSFLRISDILEAAVGAATGLSAIEGKKGEESEASALIGEYLSSGGDLETLQRDIYRAYLVAADPSGISGWEAAVKREAEIAQVNRQKAEARLEVARLELAEDKAKIARMSSGNPSSVSGS